MIPYLKKKLFRFFILIKKERIKHKKLIHEFILGADSKDYYTKGDLSGKFDRAEIVDLVLQGNIHNNDDHAFIDCVLFDRREHIEYLIQNGADIHAQRDVALIWSCYNNNITLSKFLVDHNCNVNTSIDVDIMTINIVKMSYLRH